MDNREPDIIIVEKYYKRLTDAFDLVGSPRDGSWWWAVIIPVLFLGAIFIAWMYVKDSKSIRWYYSVPLGLMRATVYGLLTYMFLLPTVKETRIWKPLEPPTLTRTSRVVVVIDVSESMANVSDDPSSKPSKDRRTRLQRVVELISDENAAFMKKLVEKNPVHFYRFGTRLDSEAQPFKLEKVADENGKERTEMRPFVSARKKDSAEKPIILAKWTEQDWINFATYTDFKPWLTRGLSDAGRAVVAADMGADSYNAERAQEYLAQKIDTIVARISLSEKDAIVFRGNLNGLDARITLARTIAQGTNVTESVQTALDAEKENMLEGIVVFSDGRSNIGVDARATDGKQNDPKLNPALEDLHRAAKKENVPIFTIGIGEVRVVKSVRITDLQTPDQTPPDDAFKVIVEVDGENKKGETVDVFLEMFPPPGNDTPFTLPGKVTFDQSEPPHGQFEWTINPADLAEKIPEDLRSQVFKGKELVEGLWKARAYTAKVNDEGKEIPNEKVYSEMMSIKIEKKSVRILLVAATANRDFQYLVTQLIRDKAEVSIVLQNDAGQFLDNKSISFLDDKFRHLSRFPDRLKVEEDPSETPETKWLNLARYDVIIAFDPDWTLLTTEQAENIRLWVDLYAGGLLLVAGPVNTKKLTYTADGEDVVKKLEPLLEVLPVKLADYDSKMVRRDRNKPRRLEFPGASPEMEFLRLDDDKPEAIISGWEQFFTGKETREQGMTAELKRGYFDFYPVKDVKAGATVVARYVEPQAADSTFDKKDPPYIVTYKYGQGWTAFLGSSEIWRFRQYKDIFVERFWVKMSRFLASGSRKKQNKRGRILMAKTFMAGDFLRSTIQLLDASLKGLPASAEPELFVKPVELDDYSAIGGTKKKDGPKKDGDPGMGDFVSKEKEDYHKSLTRVVKLTPRKGSNQPADSGYFELKQLLEAKNFPSGIWRVEVKIPNSSESLTEKFLIRKALPPELSDTRPDMLSLAAISSEVDEATIKTRLAGKPEVLEKLRANSFSHPSISGQRMAFRFDDRQSLELIPETMRHVSQEIQNPQTEPEIRRSKIDPVWFNGPDMPRWMTSWYDSMMGQSERSHQVALWMLICIGLLSAEWLTRKLLKLA